MNISRKEFMSRGDLAFDREIVKNLNPSSESTEKIPLEDCKYLRLNNSRCLALKGSCFACIDHCPNEAVNIAIGIGITIDNELCDGCGKCANVCPFNPLIIEMKAADTESIKPMERRNE
jgi:ferredoxin